MMHRLIIIVGLILGTGLAFLGCSSTSEEYERDSSSDTGRSYPPPPSGFQPQMAAVLQFEDRTGNSHNVGEAAAEELQTLLFHARRFRLVERAQLHRVLEEQNMGDVIDPATAPQVGQVLGTRFVILGAVTDFEIKTTETGSGLSVIGIGYETQSTQLDIRVGVDVRVVDSTTGELVAADSGVFRRTDSASGLGVTIIGINAGTEGSVEIDESNQGKLLRYALDDAVQKMLQDIDSRCSA